MLYRCPHPDNSPTANRHSALLHGCDCFQAIVKSVGADDLGIEFRRRVDIVIEGRETGSLKFARLHRSDLPKRDANFHAELADGTNGVEHALEFFRAVAHSTPRCAHAKTRGALRPGALCSGKNLVLR